MEQWEKLQNNRHEISSAVELLELEDDKELLLEVEALLEESNTKILTFELKKFLGGENDPCDAILTINSGAGGTESQDWAEMLMRMFIRWGERNRLKMSILDTQNGDEAGIKSTTISFQGEYAFGKLKNEVGVHRLVRISPFDSNKKRHTSFSSVFVYPDFDHDIHIEIKESDLRIDTYRSSGAGGQHVNTTDSAVRITHLPTGIVAQCQNERSQHKNKATAMKVLKAALYQKELLEKQDEKDKANSEKKKIEWGSQIRSYVLHPYQMVKDLRTNYQTSDTKCVLDGNLDPFIEAMLKHSNPS